MKQTKLFKSLLVAAGLLVGASAWAQTTTTYDFEDGNALFSSDSRITLSVVSEDQTYNNGTYTVDSKVVKFTAASNAQNGYSFSHYDFNSLCDQAAKVKVEFEANLGDGARSIISIGDASVRGNTGNSSKTTYSNKGAIFRIGTDKSYSYINGTNVGNTAKIAHKWLKVSVEVDEVAKTYSYSVTEKDGGANIKAENDIAFYSSEATNCTQIDFFGYINSSMMGLIDNLSITVTKDERKQADYTVNFLDKNGTAIKEAETRSGAVGDGITLLPSDKEAKWNSDNTQKYIYESDNTESLTVADGGTTVVNIIYRNAEVFNYTVVSSLGATLNTGSGFEGESIRVGYPHYQLDGNNLYAAGVDNKEYRTTVNLTADNVSKTVSYTLQEGKVAVFFTEAENIDGMTVVSSDNIPVRASNALAAVSSKDVTITTLPVGKYIFHAGFFTSKSSYTGLTVNFGIGNRTFAAEFTSVNANERASEEYVLAGETPIKYLASSSANTQFDYIWIESTGTPTEEELAAAEIADAKADLQAVIDEANAIDTTDKLGAEELAAAITAADTAYAAEDATVESLTAAKTALEEAVAAFEDANTTKYYIVGDMNSWGASADYLLTLNKEASTTEYYIKGLELTTSQGLKVIGVLGDNTTWYPDGENNNYYVSADGKYDIYFRPNGDGDESWHYNVIYAVQRHTYTVAGSESLFGSNWDVTDTSNDLTENEDGTYSITYTNVALSENVEYKVVQDHAWGSSWPSENRVIGISMAGNYDVTITFNPTTGDVSETMAVYKSVSEAGYATYCSPYDLNFEGTGVTAYIAKLNGTTVTFEEVTSVPNGNGLLLKAAEGSYKLPMEASTATISDNALKGVLEDTHVDKGAYVLMNSTQGVGFYKTNNDEGFTVGANTAYIPALASTARFIGFNFEDNTTTAIEGVATVKMESNKIYNLQGQRVSAARKGLYIVNGKKVLVK